MVQTYLLGGPGGNLLPGRLESAASNEVVVLASTVGQLNDFSEVAGILGLDVGVCSRQWYEMAVREPIRWHLLMAS